MLKDSHLEYQMTNQHATHAINQVKLFVCGIVQITCQANIDYFSVEPIWIQISVSGIEIMVKEAIFQFSIRQGSNDTWTIPIRRTHTKSKISREENLDFETKLISYYDVSTENSERSNNIKFIIFNRYLPYGIYTIYMR